MNNARYFEIIDTVVNNHLAEATGTDIRALAAIGVVAEVGCRYFAEVGYPEPVDVGLVADKVGTSSVVYRVGLFQGDPEAGERRPRPRAGSCTCTSTTPTRPGRSTPMPDVIRAAVTPLLRGLNRLPTGYVPRWRKPISGGPHVLFVVVVHARRPGRRRAGGALRRLPAPRRGGPGAPRGSATR